MTIADELQKLAALKNDGVLTDAEFTSQKARLLAQDQSPATVASLDPSVASAPVEEKRMGAAAKVLMVVGVLVVGFFLFGLAASNDPDTQARIKDKDVIAFCWKEQERKSLTPSAQRFAASACEMLENDFRKKWGRNP